METLTITFSPVDSRMRLRFVDCESGAGKENFNFSPWLYLMVSAIHSANSMLLSIKLTGGMLAGHLLLIHMLSVKVIATLLLV